MKKNLEKYNRIKEIAEERGCSWSGARYWYDKEIGLKDTNTLTYTALTKQDLISYGITNVTEDGRVFMGDTELNNSKSGDYIAVSHKNFPKGKIYLHRAMYVWHIGDQPADMIVDHKDENKLNNSLDNYQLLTRAENLEKARQKRIKDGTYFVKNQYTKDLSIDELKELKANKLARQEYLKNMHQDVQKIKELKSIHSVAAHERADAMHKLDDAIVKAHADYINDRTPENNKVWKDAINAKKQFVADNPKINFENWLKINC